MTALFSTKYPHHFPAQERFAEAVLSGKYRRLLLGGSIRSGKTRICVATLLLLAKAFPRSKWLVGRKDWRRLSSTTMEVFNTICPPKFIAKPFNKDTGETLFTNGSRFLWRTEDKGTDKSAPFRGLYINGALLDEADELLPATRNAVISRLGSYKDSFVEGAAGRVIYPPRPLIMTCNPNQGELKTDFYLAAKNGTLPPSFYFQNVTIRENPYVTEEDLEEFKDWPADLLRRFVDGDWDAADDAAQLISWELLNKAIEPVANTDEGGYSLGVDVARQGKDLLVYQLMDGNNFLPPITEAYTENLVDIADRIERYMGEYSIPPSRVVVDSVGLGQGVVDVLWKREKYVSSFVGGAAATTKPWESVFTFRNLKAQGYWLLREKMRLGQIGGLKDEHLRAQLASIRRYVDEKELSVDSKEKYRKRMGESSDLSDAAMYACWARFKSELLPVLEGAAI